MARSDSHILGKRSKSDGRILIRFSERYVNKLRRDYGITPSEFEAIVYYQRGCCPICLEELGIDMYVDHDHYGVESRNELRRAKPLEVRRKSIRGVLHFSCNVVLGRIERNPLLISDHVRNYLEKPPAQEILQRLTPVFPSEQELRSRKGRGGRDPAKHKTVRGKEYRWCRHHEKWHPLSKWRVRKQGEYTLYRCRERSRELRRIRSQRGGIS